MPRVLVCPVILLSIFVLVGCVAKPEISLEPNPPPAPIKQGYFGAQLGPADGETGVAIVTVLPDSPAALAGFEPGDLIQQLDQTPVLEAQTLAETLRTPGAGNRVELSFLRGGQEQSLSLTLGENPWQGAQQPDTAPGLFPVEIIADLQYRDDADSDPERHLLDLIRPVTDNPVPLMLWMHGGGWSTGSRTDDRALALRFAERGVAVASVDYRLSAGRWAAPDLPDTGVEHPAHINDVADAFAWLHRNAQQLSIDPARMFVSGHSSGGHLAALLASDGRYLKARDLELSALAGALPVGGAYDIADYHQALTSGDDPDLGRNHIHAVFGEDPRQWQHASPTEYLASSGVPMLVIVEDQSGYQRYADRLAAAATEADPDNVEFYTATGRRHGNVVLLMSRKEQDVVRARMLAFIRAVSVAG